jgi:hypothetical protein
LAAAFLLNVLLGASASGRLQFPIEADIFPLIVSGEWEEPGRSRYALPALQQRYAFGLVASLVVAWRTQFKLGWRGEKGRAIKSQPQ